jgi:hypothetical protein
MNSFASGLIHPLDFKGTEGERAKVIEQIKIDVKKNVQPDWNGRSIDASNDGKRRAKFF